MSAAIERINHLNTALVLLSCLLAYLFPYHLLIFSYTVLGPAHYLTQISWLHDRKYYSRLSLIPHFLILLALASALFPSPVGHILLLLGFLAALIAVIPQAFWPRVLLLAAGIVALTAFGHFSMEALLTLGILLPTAIHVFAFTAGFVLMGALHARSALWTLAAMTLCAASFLLMPQEVYLFTERFAHPGVELFQGIAETVLRSLHLEEVQSNLLRIFGFLSFAYTYHYLNWFSKTGVLSWHKVSRRRGWMIAALYLICMALYAYDYLLGFTLVVFLGLLHVVLEFPLNWIVFGNLGRMIITRART